MADVQLTLTIPDQHVTRVLEAFVGLDDASIKIVVQGTEYEAKWRYTYLPQQPGETTKQFAIRVIRAHIVAMIRVHALKDDIRRYDEAVTAIPIPEQNIPDDIIT